MDFNEAFDNLNKLYEGALYDVITSCTKSEFLDKLIDYLRKNDLKFSTNIIPKARLFGRGGVTSHTWDVNTYMYKDSADKYNVYTIYFGRYGAFNSDTLSDILKVFVDQKTGRVIQIDNNSIKTILPDMFKTSSAEKASDTDLKTILQKLYDRYITAHLQNIRTAFLDHDAFELEDSDLVFVSRLLKDKNYLASYLQFGIIDWVMKTFKDESEDFQTDKILEFAKLAQDMYSIDITNVDQDKTDAQDDKLQELGKKYFPK